MLSLQKQKSIPEKLLVNCGLAYLPKEQGQPSDLTPADAPTENQWIPH